MKKIFTLLVAVVFFSVTAFAQSVYKVNDITVVNKNIAQVSLISNPVKGTINLKVSNPNSLKYNISLYSNTGRKLTSIEYNHPGGISTEIMYVPDGVNGMCYLVIRSSEQQTSLKVFVE